MSKVAVMQPAGSDKMRDTVALKKPHIVGKTFGSIPWLTNVKSGEFHGKNKFWIM
jgi:hypothetical protein